MKLTRSHWDGSSCHRTGVLIRIGDRVTDTQRDEHVRTQREALGGTGSAHTWVSE